MIKVTAAIIYDNQNILIARRKEGKHLAGFWEFPGGKIEIGESPEESLKRELYEEFSIDTEIQNFIAESIYAYPNFTIQLLAYRVIILSGTFKLVDHDQIAWVPLAQMQNYKLAPADIPLLNLI